MSEHRGWIGVDLDGTLAHYGGWDGGKIGVPVPLMVNRVRQWLAEGKEVRIVTARVDGLRSVWELSEQLVAIKAWCREHIGQALAVTNEKDMNMVELWDDRCKQVEKNTGVALEDKLEDLEDHIRELEDYDGE